MSPISVLVVDDSVVIRRLVSSALESDPELTVIGTASNGKNALDFLATRLPDVVTLDIEMPVMDGITTVREIRTRWPRLPVIMFSTLTERGASATLEALACGASDYVTKPSNTGAVSNSIARVKEELVPKIKALASSRMMRGALPAAPARPAPTVIAPARVIPPTGAVPRQAETAPALATPPIQGTAPTPTASQPTPSGKIGQADILAVGCSTGGPEALTTVLKGLTGSSFPVPIVVVQHMPKIFTKLFADRLNDATSFTVHEAQAGMTLAPGHVYIAPGDFHMVLQRSGATVVTALNQNPPENFCRPAVDPMFRSLIPVFGSKIFAVVLTGMGADGRNGTIDIKRAGGTVVAQDEASSVVWGMPGAVVGAGVADAVAPLTDIPGIIGQVFRAGLRTAPPAAMGGVR